MANKELEQRLYTELAKDVTPNIKDMTRIYLIAKGYDGLYNCEGNCACKVENLMWCGSCDQNNCKAGYLSGTHGLEFAISNRKPL